ncbi:MAG: hypothetical protein ACTTKS_00490 [Bulleidia sp.]
MKKRAIDLYQRKLDYNNAYNRENYRSFSIRYNNISEKKIISWLEKQPGVKEYLTQLVVADMEKRKKAAKTARAKRASNIKKKK